MSQTFVEKFILSSDNDKIPVLPALLFMIKLFDGEKTLDDFVIFMNDRYNVRLTTEDITELQAYINSIQLKILNDTNDLNSILNNQDISLKITRAIWFTKLFPAILGLEFYLEDKNSIDSKFLN